MWKSTHVIWILAALAAVHLSATALAASGIQEYSKATRYYRGLDRPDRVLLRFETAPDAFANSEIPTEKFLRKNPALTLAGAGTHQEAYEGLFSDRIEHFKRELQAALTRALQNEGISVMTDSDNEPAVAMLQLTIRRFDARHKNALHLWEYLNGAGKLGYSVELTSPDGQSMYSGQASTRVFVGDNYGQQSAGILTDGIVEEVFLIWHPAPEALKVKKQFDGARAAPLPIDGPQQIVSPDAASLQVLRWEAFPSSRWLSGSALTADAITDVRYELRVRRLERYKGNWFNGDKIEDPPAQLAVVGLNEPLYQFQGVIPACSQLEWTVRARFNLNGRQRVTEWAGNFKLKGKDEKAAPWISRQKNGYATVRGYRFDVEPTELNCRELLFKDENARSEQYTRAKATYLTPDDGVGALVMGSINCVEGDCDLNENLVEASTKLSRCLKKGLTEIGEASSVLAINKVLAEASPAPDFRPGESDVATLLAYLADPDNRDYFRNQGLRYLVAADLGTSKGDKRAYAHVEIYACERVENCDPVLELLPLWWGAGSERIYHTGLQTTVIDLEDGAIAGTMEFHRTGQTGYVVPVLLIIPLPPLPYGSVSRAESATCRELGKNMAYFLHGWLADLPAGFVKLPDALISEDFTRTHVKLNKMLNPFPALYAPEGGP